MAANTGISADGTARKYRLHIAARGLLSRGSQVRVLPGAWEEVERIGEQMRRSGPAIRHTFASQLVYRVNADLPVPSRRR